MKTLFIRKKSDSHDRVWIFLWQVIQHRKLTIKSQSLQYHAWFAPGSVTHPLICDCSSSNLEWMTRWAVKGGNLFWSTLVWRKGKHGFCGRLSAISSIYSPRFARASNSESGSFSGVASLFFHPVLSIYCFTLSIIDWHAHLCIS